jgi:hypothetical protein
MAHVGDATSEVYQSIDVMVMQLGNIIHVQSVRLDREAFEEWVRNELPFDVLTARRIRAIHLAYMELPEGMHEGLPDPWQAMFVSPWRPLEEVGSVLPG